LIVERLRINVDVLENNAVCRPMSPKTASIRLITPILEELICLGAAMTNLSAFLSVSADARPGAAALRCGDLTTGFSVLSSDVARFADFLIDGGLRPGDRVAVMLPNRPELAIVFYGVLHAGGVVVLMSPSLGAREVEFCVTITGARILFFTHPHAVATTLAATTAGTQPISIGRHGIQPLIAGFAGHTQPAARADDDTAVILQSSGASGRHEFIELAHGSLILDQAVVARSLLNLGPDDLVLSCLPQCEGFGLTRGLLATVYAGVTLALVPRFDAVKALKMIASERVTVFEGTPAMYTAMLEEADRYDLDFSSLRLCISSAVMPDEMLRRFQDRVDSVVLEPNRVRSAAGHSSF
jgi:long-chain acyl-CoA synthetase